tara:strand:- start:95 stop:289 length:195 start_codon:yes stop_codon:yes gene_type:complete
MKWFDLLKTGEVSVEKILTMKPSLDVVMENIDMYADRATKGANPDIYTNRLKEIAESKGYLNVG